MSLKDDIYDIVCLEEGLSAADIHTRLLTHHMATSRAAKRFGPHSFIAWMLAPSTTRMSLALWRLENEDRIYSVRGKATPGGGRLDQYFPAQSRRFSRNAVQ